MNPVQVVIVGGGVMGVSLCYHLVKQGWQDIVLAEKNDLTHGSTWHAAGLCTHFAHNPTIQELRATSVRLYRDMLPEETGESCGFHKSGAMRVTRNPDRMEEFAHVAGLSSFTGYPLELLSPERIAELHPLARLEGLLGGIYEPDDGHVDPTLATNAMAKIAVQGGADIQRFNPVTSIRRENDHWLVDTEKQLFRTQHLVNAAGTWGWEIGRMMGLNIPSVPVLHQYLVTDSVAAIEQRISEGKAELPIIRDPEESWYVRQERDGFILGPYERDAQVWSVDGVPSEFGADLLPPDLERVEPIIEAAMNRIPALATAGVKSVINGPITFTPDANPLIGPAAGLDNGWLLTGSSMGVMEGGGAGWFLAHWMTHGAPPMDAMTVDSRRFGAWADREYRVEKAVECFGLQFGVHYPHEERPAARNQRLSPLHNLMLQRGAIMGSVHGWERPIWFAADGAGNDVDSFRRRAWFPAVAAEVDAATRRVAVADLSVLSAFEITGPDTQSFLNTLGANTPPAAGKVGLLHALTPAGGVQSEFTVARLNEHHAWLFAAAAAEDIDADLLRAHAVSCNVDVKNNTSSMAAIGVMGPHSRDVLAQLTDTDLQAGFPWLTAKTIVVAGHRLLALRLSYIGELGWELHLPNDAAEEVLQALETAAQPYGLGYYGAYAADSMRLEKAYAAWGADLTTERTPIESGLTRFVHTTDRQFNGRENLLCRSSVDSGWQLVLLSITIPDAANIDPFYSHPVLCNGRVTGVVTSGAYGHRCKAPLAFAWLRESPGDNPLSVSILGHCYSATLLEDPPFDAGNHRLVS